MGQQELAFVVSDCLIKNYVFALRRLLKCRGKQMLLRVNKDPSGFSGVCEGDLWIREEGGLILSVYASVYLYMFRICSLIPYLHIFMGLVLRKVKKLHHPKLTLDLLPVCLTFPFQTPRTRK